MVLWSLWNTVVTALNISGIFQSSFNSVVSVGNVLQPQNDQLQFIQLFMQPTRPSFGLVLFPSCPAGQCVLPDLSAIATLCPKTAFFFDFSPNHRKAVYLLRQVLIEQPSSSEFIRMACLLRNDPRVNSKAWYSAVMSAQIIRNDTRGLHRIPTAESIPDMFVNNAATTLAMQQAASSAFRSVAVINGDIGTDNGVENLLWYFREDILVNALHMNWHLMYPPNPPVLNGEVYKPDRRGELFYFYHHNIIARYNAERLLHGLHPVKLIDLANGTIIQQGYFAHLTDATSGFNWTDRLPNTPFLDLHQWQNPDFPFNLSTSDLFKMHDNISMGIENGYLLNQDGNHTPLDAIGGMDLIGNAIEANVFSINPTLYGKHGIHAQGHNMLGFMMDPDFKLKLPPGVMCSTGTSMRDVIFYQWHGFIDSIFEQFKNRIPPYSVQGGSFPLLWNGVTLMEIVVLSQTSVMNTVATFWSTKLLDLTNGLDFNRDPILQGPINVRALHLNHEEFQYRIVIDKTCNVTTTNGTIRIFLAPRFDANYLPMDLNQQRRFFFPLDIFPVTLNPGRNVVYRNSNESTFTVPWGKSTQQLLENAGTLPPPDCGCGWPYHLLLPKGTQYGMIYDLFAMVTNGDEDRRNSNSFYGDDSNKCKPAPGVCGIYGQKYPDSRPMNYPFDRPTFLDHSGGDSAPATIDDFAASASNMIVTQLTIIHQNVTKAAADIPECDNGPSPFIN